MTIIELLDAFAEASVGVLNATEQIVFLRAALIWNRNRRPDWIAISRAELINVTSIKSKDTIDKARKGLEQKGFIETVGQGRTAPRKWHFLKISTRLQNSLTKPSDSLDKKALGYEIAYNKANKQPRLGYEIASSQSTEYTETIEGGEILSNNDVVPTPDPPPISQIPESIMTAYQNKIVPTPSVKELEILAVLCADKGDKKVMYGIERAYERDVRDIKYIRGVVNNMREGEENGQGHRAARSHHTAQYDPQAERDKWRTETSGWHI